jgi:hypothetical protein
MGVTDFRHLPGDQGHWDSQENWCPGVPAKHFVVPVDASRDEKLALLHQLGYEVKATTIYHLVKLPGSTLVSFGAATKEGE